jgi:hypothetical protein
MTTVGLELDDRALSLARGGRVAASEPSAVFSKGGKALVGTEAWRAVRLHPMAVSTRHLGAVLAQRGLSPRSEEAVTQELRSLFIGQPVGAGERIWIASPARAQPRGLGAILGITRRLSLPVDGFLDAATVTAAALGLEQNALVLELGLHHSAATAVDSEVGHTRRRRAVLTERAGLMELQQKWLDLVSKTMVRRTRFDPLHDAATEQQLFDELPALARDLATSGEASAVVTKGNDRFEVAVTRDQFARTAESVYREITALLHQLRPAGAPMAIVLPRIVLELPGLREYLEQFVGCELIVVPDGFAAAATSLLDLPEPSSSEDGTVRLLRRLPSDGRGQLEAASGPATQTLSDVSRELLGVRRTSGPPPSHVLFDGRAYALSGAALVVGRNNTPPPYRSLTLSEGLAGVSRRHCTFVHDGDDLVLLDHSSFGTFVNGERVQERVRVHAGDRVRLGEPGVELSLIAVGDQRTQA